MAEQRLITLEGGEAAGKSTQSRRLAARLRAAGHSVIETREPGGSEIAERIRALVLERRPKSPEAEFLLFSAARADHLEATIRPALAAGKWVVCDRFIDSTRVYQGDLNRIDRAFLDLVEKQVVRATMPALTLILDLPVEAMRARMLGRGGGNRFDAVPDTVHQARRDGFLGIARAEPGRCAVIDARRGEEEIAADIWRIVSERLSP
jgi:dTMP kinase